MAALLVASATAAGGLVGFALGAVALAVPLDERARPVVAVALAALALGGDAARLRPPALHRQVPQAWGRLLEPEVVAVLYGARMGIGPATILRTWLWWAGSLAAALAGPWWSTLAGALYGAAALGLVVAASHRLIGATMRR